MLPGSISVVAVATVLPADAPPSLTWWDFAFLQALYRMRMTSTATYQRGEIEAGMKRILASVPTDEL